MFTVLIADDDADITDILRHVISRAGLTVLTATDGLDALTQAVSIIPDLLLTDLNMPGLDGIELCAAVRACPATAEMPIAVLTASRRCNSGVNSRACRSWLKPLSNHALVTGVHELLATGRHPHHKSSPCPTA
jgi:CheY-like chemotaxis protein